MLELQQLQPFLSQNLNKALSRGQWLAEGSLATAAQTPRAVRKEAISCALGDLGPALDLWE